MQAANNTGYPDYPAWRYQYQSAELAAQAGFKLAREQAAVIARLQNDATAYNPDLKASDAVAAVLALHPAADKQALNALAELMSKQPEFIAARNERILTRIESLLRGECSDFTAALGAPDNASPEDLHDRLHRQLDCLFQWMRENMKDVFEQGE